MVKNGNLPFLAYVAKVVYPRYEPNCFIIYMILKYCQILKQQQIFTLRPVSSAFLSEFVGYNIVWDTDNTVVVNGDKLQSTINVLHTDLIQRKVNVVTKPLKEKNVALITYNLLHNLKYSSNCTLKSCTQNLDFADEVNVSLINCPQEWSQYFVDTILKNYFRTPKLLYKDDVITVDVENYGKELFYTTKKITNLYEKLYFKCNKIFIKDEAINCGLCASDKCTLKQSSNVQSFIPKTYFYGEFFDEVTLCPDGLHTYFEHMRNAVAPFLKQNRFNFQPLFLIEGRKGCGKHLLVQCIASYFGMHLYTVYNFEMTANVYAQNETKLRNVFFSTKMSAPSILEIRGFENFGKNNDGEFDDRLISHFSKEIKNLFMGNSFPVIVFCLSNENDVPLSLKRTFLKTFEIKAPTEPQREQMLGWTIKDMNIRTEADLNAIANKTHGFLFEDLRALVFYAVTKFAKIKKGEDVSGHHLKQALDFMQSSYNESLGAPKVPEVKWEDIGGLSDVKEEIKKTIELPLRHPKLFRDSGLRRTGILLYGPPGTGKTLIAKAVATECGLCFLSVKGPELLNMYVGQSEQNVREVFERARDASPCIIFFDELDSLAPNRGASGDSGGVMDRVVSQLLAEMDGLNQSGTVFIIAATNRPDLIDPALLRPGRIDKLLYVGPCTDRESKISVLKALTRKFYFEDDSVIDKVVEFCPDNFSGADFYGVCSGAWLAASRRLITEMENGTKKINGATSRDVIVTVDDFESAIKTVKPSIKPEDLEYFNQLKSDTK